MTHEPYRLFYVSIELLLTLMTSSWNHTGRLMKAMLVSLCIFYRDFVHDANSYSSEIPDRKWMILLVNSLRRCFTNISVASYKH